MALAQPSVFLSCISYHLPEAELNNEMLSHLFPEWSVDKIMDKVGISTRRIAAENEFTSDLAVAACRKLFEEHGVEASSIDYLLLCTQSPDYFLPTTACLVHQQLGLLSSAGAVDINQGCSGFVYGLGLAKGLIAAGDATNVLLVTAETYSKFLHAEDKGNRSLFGDAAAAALISTTPRGSVIGRIVSGTDGSGAGNLMVKNGALRFERTADQAIHTSEEKGTYNDNYLYMNGPEIFNFTIEAVPGLVKNILSKNNLVQDDIDLFIFHQANRFMLDYLRKKINIPKERFYVYMEKCGNTVSSTIPIAIKQALTDGNITKGKKVLIAGFGVGYSWGGTVLQF